MRWLDEVGNIDVYLFDQLLKRRLRPELRVLDAGCGGGRHLTVLERNGFDWHAVDTDPHALDSARHQVSTVSDRDSSTRFRCESIAALSHPDASFDFVICCAVLHFAASDDEFDRSLRELWRVLAPAGHLFVRTASTIGIESAVGARRPEPVTLPDGSRRFLVDADFLRERTDAVGATLVDPIRTSVVDGQRAMTTWIISK